MNPTRLAAALNTALQYDIVLCAGQSNMSGRGVVDATLDAPTDHVWEFGCYSTNSSKYQLITQATNPLDYPDQGSGLGQALGPGCSFAHQYFINTGRRVLLVTAAFGGTSITAAGALGWSPYGSGNTLYLAAIANANLAVTAAQAKYPGSKVVGILWHQGEGDAAGNCTAPVYQQALVDVFAGFRAGITGASSAWIVLGQMLPEAIASNAAATLTGTYVAIDAVHTTLGAAVYKSARVAIGSGYPLSGSLTELHYNAAGARLLGVAMANAAPTAIANSGDATPAQVTGLAAGTVTGSSIPLTWTAVSGARSYTVQYSTDGGTTYATLAGAVTNTSALTNSATITGLSASTTYTIRVRANAYGATPNGAWSSTISSTTSTGLVDAFVRLPTIAGTHITEGGNGTTGWTYAATATAAFGTDNAGVSSLKMPAGVDGSLRMTLPSTGTLALYWMLGLVTANTNPAYTAGASGYKFAIVGTNGGIYKVIIDGGASTTVGNVQAAYAIAVGDVIRLARSGGSVVAQVARTATPTTFVTIHNFSATNNNDLWAAITTGVQLAGTAGPVVGNGWA